LSPASTLDDTQTAKRVLPNGLTLLLRESHRSPVVELQVWTGVGSADERPGEEGLAHFHEHMLFKGTERRGVGEVAGDIEGLGGHINAYTSFDTTVYHATLPAEAWREGLDVLADAVRHSIFDEEEVAREREVVLEEIRRSHDTPGHVLSDFAFRECYRVHPYGLPVLGPAENVAGFDRARVRRFFERWYTPDNMIVLAVGDFDAPEVAAEIERLFGDARAGEAHRVRPEEPPQDAIRAGALRRPFEGHRVDLSWPAARFADHDATHLDLLAYVLGECESSRLIQRVREREGLVDRIDASAYTPLDRGVFSIGFETDAPRLLDATRRVVEETARLCHEPIAPDELDRARINFLASLEFDRENVAGLASRIGSFEAIGGGWEREAEVIEVLKAASPADLLRVARTWLAPEGLTIAALLPDDSPAELDAAALRDAALRGFDAATRPVQAPVTVTQAPEPEDAGTRNAVTRIATPVGPARRTADGGERIDAELSNGLRVHFLRRPEIPVAAVRLACHGGLLAEEDSTSGITRFLAAMWTRGTRRHTAAEFAAATEALAAEIEGFSGRNSVGLTLDCLSQSLEPALELLSEALLEPRLAAEEVERERRETLAALERREDRLGQKAFQLFAEGEFEHHPYHLMVGGSPETVSRFGVEDLRAHAARLLRADRSALALVGDVDPERLLPVLEAGLGRLPGAPEVARADATTLPPEQPRGAGIRECELRKDREQAHLVVGFRGVRVDDPDRHVLELIAQLLAGQGGRLFLDLRDRQSLAYTVSASNIEGLAPGYFSIYIATAPEKIDRARAGILEELERLVAREPDEHELRRAIRYGTGSFAIESQRSHIRATHLALDSLYGLGPDHSEHYPSELERVTAADVLRVARRIFRLDAYTVGVVHP
jgi:zinc protease